VLDEVDAGGPGYALAPFATWFVGCGEFGGAVEAGAARKGRLSGKDGLKYGTLPRPLCKALFKFTMRRLH
jgi:hypothetical protein